MVLLKRMSSICMATFPDLYVMRWMSCFIEHVLPRKHGPMEKDEFSLHGYLSRLVCDKMDVLFRRTCAPKKQVDCWGIL